MTKKIYFSILFIIFTSGSCGILGTTPRVSETPEASKLITSDIENFYNAFDLAVRDTANAEEIFEKNYFSVGSPGLRDFYKSKIHSEEQFADFVMEYRNFYQSIRNSVTELSDGSRNFQKF